MGVDVQFFYSGKFLPTGRSMRNCAFGIVEPFMERKK